jgi:hypothetical protein
LGVGPPWYYDLDEMRRDYGDWITDYTDPKPHRYHAGLKAGRLSQPVLSWQMLLRSVVEKGAIAKTTFAGGWMKTLSAARRQSNEWPGRLYQPVDSRSVA